MNDMLENLESVGYLEGKGNSSTLNAYAFTHKDAKPGKAYYRLKQIDTDGTVAYSKIETVTLNGKGQEIILYPNPTAGNLTIRMAEMENFEVKVLNVLGQVLQNKNFSQTKNATLDLKNLPAGTYQVLITTANQQIVKKIIKTGF